MLQVRLTVSLNFDSSLMLYSKKSSDLLPGFAFGSSGSASMASRCGEKMFYWLVSRTYSLWEVGIMTALSRFSPYFSGKDDEGGSSAT